MEDTPPQVCCAEAFTHASRLPGIPSGTDHTHHRTKHRTRLRRPI